MASSEHVQAATDINSKSTPVHLCELEMELSPNDEADDEASISIQSANEPIQIESSESSDTDPERLKEVDIELVHVPPIAIRHQRVETYSQEACNTYRNTMQTVANEPHIAITASNGTDLDTRTDGPTTNVTVKIDRSPNIDDYPYKDFDMHMKDTVQNNAIDLDSTHRIQFKCHEFVLHAEVIGRVLLLFLNVLLLLLSTGYCMGQWFGSTLDLVKQCEGRTIEDIWAHSYKTAATDHKMTIASQWGHTTESCWTTKKLDTDTDHLWYSNVYASYVVSHPINAQSIAFGLLTVYCFCACVYNISTLITDSIRAFKNTLHTTSERYKCFLEHQNGAKTTAKPPKVETRCRRGMRHVGMLWSKYMANDTSGWVIRCVISELLELSIQTQALLLYNGYNIWDPNSEKNIYLANQSYFIVLFAAILAFNCLGSGVLWLGYALVAKYCHGLLFKLLLFWVDEFSDLLYTLFPFIMILFDDYNHDKWNTRVLLAQLNTDSTSIALASSFIPLLLLCGKSLLIVRSAQRELADKYYSHWKFIHDISKQKDDKQVAYQAQLDGWKFDATSLQNNNKEIFDSNGNVALTMSKTVRRANWMQTDVENKISRKKQGTLIVIALCYLMYGVGVLWYVLNHFNHAQQHCAMIQETNYFEHGQLNINSTILNSDQSQLLQRNPELFFWNKCLYKVYPFRASNECQCRVLVIDWNQTISTTRERNTYFNLTQPIILSNMLRHWSQLEKFRTHKKEQTSSLEGTKLTKAMFVARHMKAFEWTFARISCIERGISDWTQLEYFRLRDVTLPFGISNDFNGLTSMKYLSFEGNGLQTIPDSICDLVNLEVLHIQMEVYIQSIPHCISNLTQLHQLNIENCLSLTKIPLSVFNLPTLASLSLFHNQISLESLIQYNAPNNLSHMILFDISSKIKAEEELFLSLNPICNETRVWFASELHDLMSKACHYPCPDPDNSVDSQFCSPTLFGNGKCDPQCDNGKCYSDGGDCVQLCFSPLTNCTYDLYTNDVCDQECNNDYCLDYYDQEFDHPKVTDFMGPDRMHCKYHNYSDEFIIAYALPNVTCYESNSIYLDLDREKHDLVSRCNEQWIADGLCDDLCRTDECLQDGDDCGPGSCLANSCKYIHDAWVGFIGRWTYVVNISYFCGPIMKAGEIVFGKDAPLDCIEDTDLYDWNNDGFVNFREFTYLAYWFGGGFTQKGKQINCSECVGM
eukprot:143311_1